MRRLKFIFYLFSLLLFSNSVLAQQDELKINGSVFDPGNEPAMFSTIMLLNQDSVLVGGALSTEDGLFEIDKVIPGDYFVQVKNIGFHTYTSKKISVTKSGNLNLGKIILIPSVVQLNEAVVVARKAMVEIHADKMVFNVASSVNASGNNGMELISKAPGIIVDMDKNIILQGKTGVKIYINNRPSRLSGDDLTNFLESLRSENIESLEIITNPSSKYDAEGTAGIINIVLKKNTGGGFNGSSTASFSKGNFSKTNIGSSINFSSDKLTLFSNINIADDTWQFNFNEKAYQRGFLLDKLSEAANGRKSMNFSGGMDYSLNDKNSFSIDARVLMNSRNNVLISSTGIYDTLDFSKGEILRAKALDVMPSQNYILNSNYRYTINESSFFTSDFSFGKYSGEKQTKQPNEYFDANTNKLLRTFNKEYEAGTKIDLWSFKVDYEKKFEKSTLSSGAKYSYITTSNELDFFNIENNIPVFDKNRSNEFTYLEKVAAFYLIWDYKPSTKLGINAGMRLENTSSLGSLVSEVRTQNDNVSRNYFDVFPNFGISYDDQKNSIVSISYGRRITRPNYQDLNPFESRASELSAWKGNPFLKPNYIDNYQISYSFKRKLVISNNYSVTHDFFATIFEISQEKGNVLIPRNMQKATNNGITISYPFRFFKWWELSSFFNHNYETYTGDLNEAKIDLEASIYNFRFQNNLQLPANITMEFTYQYNSPWIWRGSVNVEGNYGINMGFKKDFLNKKLLLQITANDILGTQSDYYYRSNYGGMKVKGVVSFDNQRAGINLTYKFGNEKAKTKKKGKSGIDDEIRRISE